MPGIISWVFQCTTSRESMRWYGAGTTWDVNAPRIQHMYCICCTSLFLSFFRNCAGTFMFHKRVYANDRLWLEGSLGTMSYAVTTLAIYMGIQVIIITQKVFAKFGLVFGFSGLCLMLISFPKRKKGKGGISFTEMDVEESRGLEVENSVSAGSLDDAEATQQRKASAEIEERDEIQRALTERGCDTKTILGLSAFERFKWAFGFRPPHAVMGRKFFEVLDVNKSGYFTVEALDFVVKVLQVDFPMAKATHDAVEVRCHMFSHACRNTKLAYKVPSQGREASRMHHFSCDLDLCESNWQCVMSLNHHIASATPPLQTLKPLDLAWYDSTAGMYQECNVALFLLHSLCMPHMYMGTVKCLNVHSHHILRKRICYSNQFWACIYCGLYIFWASDQQCRMRD
jgi:hypothetical protein